MESRLDSIGRDRGIQLLCIWAVGAILGMILIGGFIPPQDPAASGQEIADWYSENATSIRIGMVISMSAFTLFAPFGVAIAIQTRRSENRPVMTYVQIACAAIAALEGVMAALIWATAAFRADEIAPDITRAINDLGWFAFLFDIPPFTVWMAAIGIAILRDRGTPPVFPRWVGYLNLWAATFILPGMLMAFFKTGPFAYDGLLALYLPFTVFFAWMIVMTVVLLRIVARESAEAAGP
jgi:energy-converting hydrogenase Eha subunit E